MRSLIWTILAAALAVGMFTALASERLAAPALPNLGEQAMTEMSLEVGGSVAGATSIGPFEPASHASDGDGHAVVQFDEISKFTAAGDFTFEWGEEILVVFEGPNAQSRVLGFVYDVKVSLGSDSTLKVTITVWRQTWYCGPGQGLCFVTTADYWFKPYECIGGHYYKEAGKPLVCVPNE